MTHEKKRKQKRVDVIGADIISDSGGFNDSLEEEKTKTQTSTTYPCTTASSDSMTQKKKRKQKRPYLIALVWVTYPDSMTLEKKRRQQLVRQREQYWEMFALRFDDSKGEEKTKIHHLV